MIRSLVFVATLCVVSGLASSEVCASVAPISAYDLPRGCDLGPAIGAHPRSWAPVPSFAHSPEGEAVWKEECRSSRIKKTRRTRGSRSTLKR